MARGDFALFEQFAKYFLNATTAWDLASGGDSIRLGIVNNTATVPIITATDPTWNDFSANEVTPGAGSLYPADGFVLTGQTYTEAAGVATFDAANITLTQTDGGFEDAYWGVLYNQTVGGASGECIGILDLGGPVSELAGPIVITWNASGIFTVTITP